MSQVYAIGHNHLESISEIIRLFYHKAQLDEQTKSVGTDTADSIYIESHLTGNKVTTLLIHGNVYEEHLENTDEIYIKRAVKRQLYKILSEITGITFPWGSLTGIRPTYIAREYGYDKNILMEQFDVSEEKALLCVEAARNEDAGYRDIFGGSVHCYIGVPICRTKCHYCSFVSGLYRRYESYIPAYTDAICREIDTFMPLFPQRLQSIYVGGGTPTVLPQKYFDRILDSIGRHLHPCVKTEFTVEAGRPDSITLDGLKKMKNARVTRICINPQTMNDRTLKLIHRDHTVQDFLTAYQMAREVGFDTINVDVIAGLPGETAQDFINTLQQIERLFPDQITIHSLSIKRSSDLYEVTAQGQDPSVKFQKFTKPNQQLSDMIMYGSNLMKEQAYVPYYLYRQKETAGGQENVGYAKPGKHCIYNIAMMSDRYTVLGIGAKAMSKRVYSGGKGFRVERFSNIRDIILYTEKIDQQIRNKLEFFSE